MKYPPMFSKQSFVFAVSLMLLAACQAEIIEPIMDEPDEIIEQEDTKVTPPDITAVIEPDCNTKSILEVDGEGVGTIYWTPADEINVFYGTTSTHYVSQNVANATTAVFSTTDVIGSTEGESNNIWGLYPYNSSATCTGSAVTTTLPTTQYGVPGTFDEDLFITIAHNTSTALQFFNVCGGIKFTLSRNDITRITFRGNDNEDIAGDISISIVNELPQVSVLNGAKQITLTPKTGDTFASGTNYYFVLLPTTLASGFTMTFETETQLGTFNYTSKPVQIKRSVFGKKTNINTYASFDYIDIPEGPVDLGLSVLWASYNLGASQPTDYGDYFAWGETSTYYGDGYAQENPQQHWVYGKTSGYSWDSYSLCDWGDNTRINKYGYDDEYGTVDNKRVLELCDDAAHRLLGGKWRMPTYSEWLELKNNCSVKEVTYRGEAGYKIRSKKDGYTDKWLFLPKAGYRDGTNLRFVGSTGYYWSSTLADSYPCDASGFSYNWGQLISGDSSRSIGNSIRAVYDDSIVESITDLSSTSTANCYIVSSSGKYKFKAVKGNTNTSVGTVAEVQVLWESFGTEEAPSVGDIIKSDVSYSNGYIYFNVGAYHKGNAVIAALSSYGSILWSWHIWCTDQPESQNYYAGSSLVGTMMDRNLGATTAIPGEVKALGLLYQWGRKDPFLCGGTINSGLSAASTLSWPSPVNSSSSTGNTNYAIQHPTTFINGCEWTLDWRYSTGSYATENTRWGSSKTEYDPCPAGWQVPSGGPEGIWASAFQTSSEWTTASNWDATHRGMDFGKTNWTLGWYSNDTIWYPAASAYIWRADNYLTNPGQQGFYWSYTYAGDATGSAYILFFDDAGKVAPANYGYGCKSNALSVRCQKIQ